MLSKLVMVFAVVMGLGLFWPRFDLYERESIWNSKYVLRETGYWKEKACLQAGKKYLLPTRCIRSSTWDEIWGRRNVYNE